MTFTDLFGGGGGGGDRSVWTNRWISSPLSQSGNITITTADVAVHRVSYISHGSYGYNYILRNVADTNTLVNEGNSYGTYEWDGGLFSAGLVANCSGVMKIAYRIL